MFKPIYSFFHKHYHRRYHGIYRHAKQLFVFDLILLATALFMLGATIFFFLWKPGITDQIELKISLGNNRVISGEEVHLTVDYINHSKYKLTNAVLALHLPDGFVVDRTRTGVDVFSNDSTFTISNIAAGGKGQVGVYGHMWTTPGQQEEIIASLAYSKAGSDQIEQKLSSFFATLPESVIGSYIEVTTSTFPGRTIAFTFNLTNKSAEPVTDLNITPASKEIIFNSALPTHFTLAPNETKSFAGKITAPKTGRSFTLTVTPHITVNNHSIDLNPGTASVAILSPHLTANVTMVSTTPYLEPGGSFTAHVDVKINSPALFKNIVLRLTNTPGIVDMNATAKASNAQVDGNDLVFDKNNRTNLADNQTNGSDDFDVTIILKPTFTFADQAPAKFELIPVMTGDVAGVANDTFSETGTGLAIQLATDLTMQNSVRYYTTEGDQLGRGPLPPQIGQTTKYWIFVQVNNTSNPVTDAKFQTTLAPGVSFTGNQSVTVGGNLQYNSGSGQVTWSYPELPASSQTGLYFEVSVNPNPEQIGKVLTLTKNTIFTATDKVVGKQFNLTKSVQTNVLPSNDQGSSAGATVR